MLLVFLWLAWFNICTPSRIASKKRREEKKFSILFYGKKNGRKYPRLLYFSSFDDSFSFSYMVFWVVGWEKGFGRPGVLAGLVDRKHSRCIVMNVVELPVWEVGVSIVV